jgi:hypothetical protein
MWGIWVTVQLKTQIKVKEIQQISGDTSEKKKQHRSLPMPMLSAEVAEPLAPTSPNVMYIPGPTFASTIWWWVAVKSF